MTVIPLRWWFIVLLIVGGCAEERFLSKDDDDEMRATCEKDGCAVIPNPLWKQIERTLGLTGT